MVGCGAWSAPLLLLTAVIGPAHERASAVAFYLLALVFNYPHFMATVHRAYHTREEFSRYRIFTVHITLLLALAVAGTHAVPSLLPWIFTLYICWSPWHYTGQNFGLLMMFARRGGVQVAPGERRLLFWSFVASYVMLMISFHTGPSNDALILSLNVPPALAAPARAATGGLFLMLGGIAFLRLRSHASPRQLLAPFTLLITQGLWFVLPLALELASGVQVPQTRYSSGILAILHSAQYIWITTYYVQRESAQRNHQSLRRSLLGYFATLIAGGIGLFICGPWLVSLLFRYDFSTSFLIFTALVNIHHFILDGAIWKLRDSRIASLLLARADPPGGQAGGEGPLPAAGWLGSSSAAAYAFRVVVALLLFLWGGFDQLHFFLGTSEGNLARLSRAARMNPWDAGVQLRLARGASRAGDREQAIAALERAVAANPLSRTAQHELARALLEAGRIEDAREHYRKFLALFPRDADALISFGLTAAQLGHAEEALDSWRRALEIDPAQAGAELYLAEALDRSGQRAAAIRHYETYVRLASQPENAQRFSMAQRISATLALADARMATNQAPGAIAAAQLAQQMARNAREGKLESLSHARLGEYFERAGRPAEAAASYQKGLAVDRTLNDAGTEAVDWFNYGQFLLRAGRGVHGQPQGVRERRTRLAYACFLQAEELAGNSANQETRDTIQRARRDAEAGLGAAAAAAVRRERAQLLGEALSLPAASFTGNDSPLP